MAGVDVERLWALGLLAARVPLAPEGGLLALCAAGALLGGVSVALDVRPDELVGPLCQRLGGEALALRVLEVRTSPPELWVRLGTSETHWPVPDVGALVRALNHGYRRMPGVRAIAVLGTLDGAWQLWCLPKEALRTLQNEGLLEAQNAEELSALG